MKKYELQNCGTVISLDLTKDKDFGHVVVELVADQVLRIIDVLKVVEKETSGSITFKNEYWSDGVSPNGNMAFNDIFTKALNDLGPKFMPISKLLK